MMAEQPDELEALLHARAGTDDSALREAVLRRTSRLFTTRRWTRRATRVAAAVVLLLFGGLTGWFAKPSADLAAPVREYVAVPVPVVLPPTDSSSPSEGSYLTAEKLELEAEQASDRGVAATLYR